MRVKGVVWLGTRTEAFDEMRDFFLSVRTTAIAGRTSARPTGTCTSSPSSRDTRRTTPNLRSRAPR